MWLRKLEGKVSGRAHRMQIRRRRRNNNNNSSSRNGNGNNHDCLEWLPGVRKCSKAVVSPEETFLASCSCPLLPLARRSLNQLIEQRTLDRRVFVFISCRFESHALASFAEDNGDS